jgi:predicted AAA+ superfamily ATPase
MFNRKILSALEKWAIQKDRKPLVLRGARQVGKTTVVTQFSSQFEQYIYLNLELHEDKQPFEQFSNIETLVQTLFFIKNKEYSKKQKTLLFIDEIQEVPEALNMLRYFYEQAKEIYVIAAGSLLETLFNQHISFPVGRVEYLVVRPVSFPEFLGAVGEKAALQQLETIPLAKFANDKLLKLFHTYALIGGMPGIVNHYVSNKDLIVLSNIYESLIVSYSDDVEKYASSPTQVQLIRHAMRSSYIEAGKRIKYQGFGKSNYGSREMGEALRVLEKALLIYLVFPNTGAKLPLSPDLKKSPRLHVLDTGMMNYFLGVQKEIIGTTDLNNVYQGTVIEHLVGQELLATQFNALSTLHFWVREKKTSTAEVDYLYSFEGQLIPIEVKSGREGKLKSLHLFMDMAPHNMAIRFYAGELHISTVETPENKTYYLLNLPYYLVSQIEHYLNWFKKEINI